MSAKGSTAMDFLLAATAVTKVASGGVATLGEPSATTTCEAVANRSSGSLASARVTTWSRSVLTAGRAARTDGTGSVNRFMINAWAFDPVNGADPASIS